MGSAGLSDFGPVLRRRRLAAGLTQEELAVRAGLSVRALRDLERGTTTRPYRNSIGKLADALTLGDAERAEFMRIHRPAAGSLRPEPARPVPRQLPAATADFTGRTAELKHLTG